MASSVAQPRAVLAQRRSDFARRDAPRVAKVVRPARVRAAPARAAVAEPASAPGGVSGVERGSGHEVHKFGGTCVGSFERISGVCDLLIESAKSGVKTFGVVSAMGVATKGEPKVTDCLINATDMAAARNPAAHREPCWRAARTAEIRRCVTFPFQGLSHWPARRRGWRDGGTRG